MVTQVRDILVCILLFMIICLIAMIMGNLIINTYHSHAGL